MSVNIRDIAEKCRISKSTVSRVLNNNPNVSDATRTKVLDMMRDLRYDPLQNFAFARNIKTRRIGLVISSDVDDDSPFFHRAYTSFRRSVHRQGYEAAYYTSADINEKLQSRPDAPTGALPVDGLVFFCPHGDWDRQIAAVRNRSIRCVLIRRRTELPDVPVVTNSDYDGGMQLFEHLHAAGHRRFAVAGGGNYAHLGGNLRAFDDFMETHGLPPLAASCRWHEGTERTFEAWVPEFLAASPRPTVCVCSSDGIAIRLIKELKRRGVRVPEDLSVAGFDNDYVAGLFSPALTTVDIPVGDMVAQAVRIIDDDLHGVPQNGMQIKLPCRLIERESVLPAETDG